MPYTRRPRVLIFALVLGALALLAMLAELGPAAFAGGLAMAVVPVPLYLLLALWIDRYEPEPARMLATTFLWGASVAAFLSLLFNSIAIAAVGLVLPAHAEAATVVLVAPAVEEIAKGLALLFVWLQARDEFDNVTDGVVYAAMVGLGFAMTENVQYYGNALLDAGSGGAAAWPVFFLRGVAAPFAHPLFTAMTGIGLGLAMERHRGGVPIALPLLGLAGAIALHLLWNLSSMLGDAFYLTYLLVMVPVFAGTLLVVRDALRRESQVIREQLAAQLAAGMLTDAQLATLCSVRGRLADSLRAAQRGGMSGWRRQRAFHIAATELAFLRWRAARGDAPDPAAEEAWAARLVALAPACDASGGGEGQRRPAV